MTIIEQTDYKLPPFVILRKGGKITKIFNPLKFKSIEGELEFSLEEIFSFLERKGISCVTERVHEITKRDIENFNFIGMDFRVFNGDKNKRGELLCDEVIVSVNYLLESGVTVTRFFRDHLDEVNNRLLKERDEQRKQKFLFD